MSGRLWPFYSDDVPRRLLACFRHGDLGGVEGHPAVAQFEAAFVERLAPGHKAAFFNSGTSALCAGLFALKLPKGSEVVVPRRTFRSTVSPLMQFGLVPQFAECGPDGCVDADAVSELVSGRTSAILLTHQWGQPADLVSLAGVAQSRGLALIEDCSHAHGTCYRGQPVGTFGTFSFFSCGTTKMVSGGTGGMLVTSNADVFERALSFGQPKSRCDAIESESIRRLGRVGAGVNLRGSPFSATLAQDHLQFLDRNIAQKDRNLRMADEIMSAECKGLRPVSRQADWTSGTWYKRPYAVDAAPADAWVRAAATSGIALAHQDPPLDKLLEPVGKEYGIDWQPVRPSERASTPLIVLNTLDMYSPDWKPGEFHERVLSLSAIAA